MDQSVKKLVSCLGYTRRMLAQRNLNSVRQHVDAALHLLMHPEQRAQSDIPEPSFKMTLCLDDLVRGCHSASSGSTVGATHGLVFHEVAVQTDQDLLLATMSETIASSVKEQMEPLFALLKQAQDQSEAVAKRCQDLEVRQSEMHEKTNKLSSDLSGVPGENPTPTNTPMKRSSAISACDEQGPPVPTGNADPSQLKELRREGRRRALEAIAFGR